jgi:hypothetical protein
VSTSTTIVAVLCGAWLLLTVANAVPKLDRVLNVLPVCFISLIPSWSFFAPHPANSDVRLLYRDYFPDDPWGEQGAAGPWRELWPLGAASARSLLFDPMNRTRKALSDATSALMRHCRDGEVKTTQLVLSVPYLMILNKVANIERERAATGCQFVIVKWSLRGEPPEVVFLSAVHRTSASAQAATQAAT